MGHQEENAVRLALQLIVQRILTTKTARGSAAKLQLFVRTLTTLTARGIAAKLLIVRTPRTQTVRGSAAKLIVRTLTTQTARRGCVGLMNVQMLLAVGGVAKLAKPVRRTLILPNVANALGF